MQGETPFSRHFLEHFGGLHGGGSRDQMRPIIHQAFGLEPEGIYPMYHTYDEIFVFVGTNPNDPLDLGRQIDFWLGAGEHAEKQVITKSSYIFVPAGMKDHEHRQRRT